MSGGANGGHTSGGGYEITAAEGARDDSDVDIQTSVYRGRPGSEFANVYSIRITVTSNHRNDVYQYSGFKSPEEATSKVNAVIASIADAFGIARG